MPSVGSGTQEVSVSTLLPSGDMPKSSFVPDLGADTRSTKKRSSLVSEVHSLEGGVGMQMNEEETSVHEACTFQKEAMSEPLGIISVLLIRRQVREDGHLPRITQ